MKAINPLLPEHFHNWFLAKGWSPHPHQLEMIDAAQSGDNTLLIAPTGAGKTLGGFLPSLIDLAETIKQPEQNRTHGLHTLYISPLKVLSQDVARNLVAPVSELELNIRIETRTGDTPQHKRARQRQYPPDILLTTPEQLALFCAQTNGRAYFEGLHTVIIDELHAIAPQKRGDLLSLGLATITKYAPKARRVGLSATVNDIAGHARWLNSQGKTQSRSARIVCGAKGTDPDIRILDPKERIPWSGHSGRHTLPEVYAAIKQARTTLIFVNTRSQAEIIFQELWAINDDNLAIALHHGSLFPEQRRKVEAATVDAVLMRLYAPLRWISALIGAMSVWLSKWVRQKVQPG